MAGLFWRGQLFANGNQNCRMLWNVRCVLCDCFCGLRPERGGLMRLQGCSGLAAIRRNGLAVPRDGAMVRDNGQQVRGCPFAWGQVFAMTQGHRRPTFVCKFLIPPPRQALAQFDCGAVVRRIDVAANVLPAVVPDCLICAMFQFTPPSYVCDQLQGSPQLPHLLRPRRFAGFGFRQYSPKANRS